MEAVKKELADAQAQMSDLRRQRETCRAQITSLKEQLQQQYLQQNTCLLYTSRCV